MFEEENDNKIYNLLISNGHDQNNEYNEFHDKLFSKKDFLWKESFAGSLHLNESFFNKIDAIILLAGLYEKNKEKIDALIESAITYEKPIILVRPYGVEEVPEDVEKVASAIVGWNANCIVNTIKDVVLGIYDDFV
ncbi:TIR domain-containing protein [Methanobrevibacter filiformis]|uniref:Thoeris protein ThsB TIR-like domain-containing protein n=1 Tax=Methanobrevibacter filiformis TaxID=55758 RepID=A0A166FB79_9EURY|nr:nuclease [Methanobrevibacter filiformis]KZX17490.1 hypothetical protein MBFIL_01480 [Methanobrevibacter filiformis]